MGIKKDLGGEEIEDRDRCRRSSDRICESGRRELENSSRSVWVEGGIQRTLQNLER